MIERLTVMSCETECEAFVCGANQREVRREARAQGWRVSAKHGDYCPDCRRHELERDLDDDELDEDRE